MLRGPERMKSALLSVRHSAKAGISIAPPIESCVAGVIPSQSHPRRMILPSVLIATPRWSSGSGTTSRTR